jgi:hypothetical protein
MNDLAAQLPSPFSLWWHMQPPRSHRYGVRSELDARIPRAVRRRLRGGLDSRRGPRGLHASCVQ